MGITLDDGGLSAALDGLGQLAVRTAITATVNEMAEDLRASTPRDSGGLVNSLRQEVTDTEGYVGYNAEYAPHVEYGHRQQVGRYVPKLGKRLKAPYVEGRHFLSQEVRRAQPILERRVGEALREAGL
ncbi:HK97 gp10 family phage protein [Olsenella profusa]|uniref:Tail protein, HK97 family n=1 Tax=Olsenella profusa F0195 TaxID=1125712 RepID=U2TUQ2_9ACTN|nr:HK97 gp10 family phage protein [Olsenella profusa]ERL09788.1 tail protein, HK97 family [Olsenella profusa F0195]